MVLNDMKAMKKSLIITNTAAALILGCSKPVFKVHGSAKASTLKNAIALTVKYESGIISEITAALQNEKTEKHERIRQQRYNYEIIDEFEKDRI